MPLDYVSNLNGKLVNIANQFDAIRSTFDSTQRHTGVYYFDFSNELDANDFAEEIKKSPIPIGVSKEW